MLHHVGLGLFCERAFLSHLCLPMHVLEKLCPSGEAVYPDEAVAAELN
jgi:hypothetical protein